MSAISGGGGGRPQYQDEIDFANDETLADESSLNPEPASGETGADALDEPITFKRKQKSTSRFSLRHLFPFASSSSPLSDTPSAQPLRPIPSTDNRGETHGDTGAGYHKAENPVDGYIEGPGQRVGYDNLTAIDWIFEYTKERQRLRHLHSTSAGFVGHFRQLLSASYVWLVLVSTGVAVGVLAACIVVASDWLGDIKVGYCRAGDEGGRFYLNRSFCCWGHDDPSECKHWIPWGDALGVQSKSGGYVVGYIFFTLYSVVFAASAGYLVLSYANHAKHSGIPEIKTVLGGFIIRSFMGSWTLIIKCLGLCLAVASGMWLGKEGPLVHVACCCANLIMKPIESLNHNEARKREVLSAAAAAGISVAFGSPIGGVLFSLEQLSYYFPDKTMWQSFVCATVAAVTLHALNPFRTGKIVLYQVTYSRNWHLFEILPFIALGILGGLYGGLFIKLNLKFARWRKTRKYSFPLLEVAIVALMTALINFPNIFMRAQMGELVLHLFAECDQTPDDSFGLCKTGAASAEAISLLLLASLCAFFLAAITFGLDVPAGIILPSLAIGALYGRALGTAFEIWQKSHPEFILFSSCEPDEPCITPGTYAIIGAAAALGGATRMTVSIVVIMFELTGALAYVIPIMVAVMLSKWCGDTFGKRGIYESWIRLNEYPFLDQKDDALPPEVPVNQVITGINDLTVIAAAGHTIESLRTLLSTTSYRGYPVVSNTSNPVLLGYISRNELSYALKTPISDLSGNHGPETQVFFAHQPFADPLEILDLRPWMDQTPVTMGIYSSFEIVLNMFERLGLRYVLFVNKGVLEGLLTKKDIWYIVEGVGRIGDRGVGAGALRTAGGGTEEERGLLRGDGNVNEHRARAFSPLQEGEGF